MIKLINVNKYFNKHKKNQIHVINDTNLTLPKTGLVSLLGPSGSGKTTLLNAIGGLDKVNSGEIYVNNQKLTRFSTAKIDEIRNLNIGYIFQDYNLIDSLSVFENIALVLKMIGIKDKAEITKRVNYVLEVLGLYRYRNRFTSMLSGGERQRVGIARAIVKNPNIIIADEPTGNLDSKNTLEIMNIIKAISKDKLVILVTHEKDLANFYSSRIIELADGKIVSDKENDHALELDYRIDNKIYLKDMKNHQEIKKDNLNINYYSDEKEPLNILLVVKNGNIYIENNEIEKVEVIDDNSNIEIVDEHYKKINKDETSKYQFKFNEIINNNFKLKYKSIFNPVTLIINGFKKVFNYPFLKKILLGGFFVSAMFILYSVSNIMGITNIKDSKFVTVNKNYLNLIARNKSINNYLEYEKLDSVNYILPSNSIVNFKLRYNYYYQTANAMDNLKGSLASTKMLNKNDIIYGKMPSLANDVVVDLFTINNMFKSNIAKQVGVRDAKELIGKTITIDNMNNFTIVGIVDLKSPSIYVDETMFIDIIANSIEEIDSNKYPASEGQNNIINYNLLKDKITLKEGRIPSNDYEVIVNISNKEAMPLNKEIDYKINGIKLKVVGYYDNKYNMDNMIVNSNTIKYSVISNNTNFVIYPKDKDKTLSYFNEKKLNIYESYERSRSEYISSVKEKIISSIIFASIIMIISLIEIFLMIRASFLSRIKEVGTLRAIGVKKGDIYKMFLGEIISITTMGSMSGFVLMLYALSKASSISMFKDQYLINPFVIMVALIIIYGFNIIVGLLPVFTTLRKTPAAILSRTDI
ncbi:MAG: ABC transporter ATP-binding protein/permease [Bacilli bacterium]